MATASSAAKACFNTDFVRWVQGLKGDKREMLRRIVSGGVLEGTSAKNCLRRLQLQTYVKLIRCDDRQTEPHFPADVPVPEVPEVPALSPASDNSQRPCPLSRKRPSVTREEVTPKRRKSVDVVLVKYVTKKPVEVINIVSPDCDSPLTPTDTNDLEGDAIEDNPPSELKPASPTSERTVPRCISPVKPSVISQSIDATASSAASSGATEAIPQSSSLPSPSKEADGNADQKRSPSSKVPQRESFHAEENTLGSSQTTPTPSGPSPAGLQEVLKGMASEIYEAEIEFVRLDNRVKSFENDEGKKNSRTYQALLDSNAVLTMKAASIKSCIDRDIVKRFGKQFYPDLLAEVQKIPRLHLYSTMRLMTVLNVLLQLAEPVSSVTKPIQSSTASNSPPSEVTSPSITCPASNQSCQPVPACETAVVQTTFQHTPVTSRQAVQPIVATNNRNDLSLVQLLSTSARTSEALQPRPQQTSAISQPKCVLPQQVQSHLPSTSNQCRPHANARVPLLEQTARKQRILPAPQHQPSNQQHPHVERRQQSHQNNQQYQKPAQVRQMQQLYAASNSNMQQPPGIHQGQYSNRTVASTNLHVTGTHSLQGADKNSSRPNHNIVHRVASSSASTYSAKPNVPSISSVSSSVGVSSIARSSALPVRAPTVSSLQVPTYNQQSIRLTQIVAQSQKSSSVVPQTSTPNQVLQAQTQNTGNVYHRRDVPQTSNISKLQQAMQAPRQQQSTQQPQHINQRPQLLQQPQQNLQQPQQIFQQPQQIFQQPQQIFQQPQQMYVQSQRTVQQPTQVFQQPQQIVQLPRQIVQQPQQIVQQQAQIVQQPHRIVQQSQQIVQQQPQIVQQPHRIVQQSQQIVQQQPQIVQQPHRIVQQSQQIVQQPHQNVLHSHQMVQQPQQIVQQQHQVFQQTHQVVNLPQQAVQQPHQVARQPQQIAQQPYQQYNGALGVYAVSGVQVQTVPYVQQTLPSTLPVTATYQQHVAHIPSVQESGTNFQVVAQMSPVIRACSRDSGISTPEPAVRDFIEEQINGSQQQRR